MSTFTLDNQIHSTMTYVAADFYIANYYSATAIASVANDTVPSHSYNSLKAQKYTLKYKV